MQRGFFMLAGVALGAPVAAQTVQPGLWEYTSQVTDAQMPGLPPAALAGMKKVNTLRRCVTPAEAAQGPRDALQRTQKTCRFTRYSASGGKLDAVMQCQGGMTMTTQGSFMPTSFSATGHMVTTGGRGMKMTVQSSGKLLGPCK